MSEGIVKYFRASEKAVLKLERMLLAVLLLLILIVLIIQVVCRYVLYIPTPWAEEIARYAFIWLSFVGAGTAFATNEHIEIDAINTVVEKIFKDNSKKNAVNKGIYIVALVITVVFLLALGLVYSQFIMGIARRNPISPSLKIPLLIPMGGVLIGIILMLYHAICRISFPLDKPTNKTVEVDLS